MMKQYQLAMPQQVFSGETGMQALESLAARHKKAAVFTLTPAYIETWITQTAVIKA